MKYIILTKYQANRIKGEYGKYSALQPILILSGEFILPIQVLKEYEFTDVWDYLRKLPQREVKKDEFIKSEI